MAIFILGALGFAGLSAISPGQVTGGTAFRRLPGDGPYHGLALVNPFSVAAGSPRGIRNKETPTVKVNDSDGNPIEIAAVVVWQVRDSARATYGVEDFIAFVDTQSETALRHVANGHPYDNAGTDGSAPRPHRRDRRPTGGRDRRPGRPGRCRRHRGQDHPVVLRPEIAQVMLQRQQASAVVAARSRIVEGAVGMVQMALGKLSQGSPDTTKFTISN